MVDFSISTGYRHQYCWWFRILTIALYFKKSFRKDREVQKNQGKKDVEIGLRDWWRTITFWMITSRQWKSGYPGCLWYMSGMTFPTQLYWDYFINHDIRIPIKQAGLTLESRAGFYSWLTWIIWASLHTASSVHGSLYYPGLQRLFSDHLLMWGSCHEPTRISFLIGTQGVTSFTDLFMAGQPTTLTYPPQK